MLHRRVFLGGAAALWSGAALARRPEDSPLRVLADGGSVALIRHAAAPGTGDPPGFRLGDCATQRNLSEAGRRQAAELGRALREAGVLVTQVRSSRWCRALDTATLAFPNVPITPDATLDSFFDDSRTRGRQTDAARALIDRWAGRQGTLVLVTHHVNIAALTEVAPAEGEIVVCLPRSGGSPEVVGRVKL